ncbi:hypothetical protein HZH68_008182 [Vespula germanica]|uniref:Uncharacterized protein n=1 Tax=Vespula germanica TaxID=30212 RepID=A0A834N8E6_VESGE|nr:hypothetical protein HZH68_008182 [Vespula germanica]
MEKLDGGGGSSSSSRGRGGGGGGDGAATVKAIGRRRMPVPFPAYKHNLDRVHGNTHATVSYHVYVVS